MLCESLCTKIRVWSASTRARKFACTCVFDPVPMMYVPAFCRYVGVHACVCECVPCVCVCVRERERERKSTSVGAYVYCAVAVRCSVLQCVAFAVCCRVLPCVAVCCRALQCVAVCFSALQSDCTVRTVF